MITFSLTATQEEKFNIWKEHIKDIFNEYGEFTFSFTSYGIGDSVTVYSTLLKSALELTEIENW